MRDLKLGAASLLLPLLATAAAAQSSLTYSDAGFADSAFATGITNGTAMAFTPDGRLLVCEQGPTASASGSALLKIFSVTGTLLGTFHTFTVDSRFERGLLGVAVDPDFTLNQFVYAYYTVPTAPIHNRVVRLVANGNVSTGAETLVVQLNNLSTAENHNGGAIHFGIDGKLYVAVGDNANSANSQLLTNRLGKILRINPDGSNPPDNPTSFPGITGTVPPGPNQAIWGVGLRNPFTFAVQPVTGRTFINDVGGGGASAREEINDGIGGSNYGWPVSEGYTMNPNHRSPLHAYDHSGGECAITGGTFYDPPTAPFPASYVGKYFFSDLCGGWIRVMDPSNNSVTGFATGLSSCVDLKTGPDGRLYCLNRGANQVLQVRYTGVVTQNIIVSTDTITVLEQGAAGNFGVKLAADPGTGNSVVVGLTVTLANASVTLGTSQLTFTGGAGGTWNTYQSVSVTATNDADADDGGVTVLLSSTGLADRSVAVTVIDNDRPVGTPTARIVLPRQGQTVSGTGAEFFGDGTDNSSTTRAEFYVDGTLIYTDTGTSGHYHVGGGHASWNTTTLANGPHVLRMVVFDNNTPTALSGAHQIIVIVNNALGGGGSSDSCGSCGMGGTEALLLLATLVWRRRRK